MLGRFGPSLRRQAAWIFTLDTRSLATYRIGLGSLLVADCLLRRRDFGLMLTPDGVMPPGLVRTYLGHPAQWSVALVHDAAWWNGGVLAAEGLAGVFLMLGLFTRPATILGWIAVVSLIRRTLPATNSGDIWLACQLLWAAFLPLGARWSLDSRRAPVPPPGTNAFSIATVAAVLQLVAVYVGAGLAKCNPTWFGGDAVRRGLSVHDHGTALGMVIGSNPWITRPLQWIVPIAEIVLPFLLLAIPSARVRLGIVGLAIAFHAGIWALMSVGLFAAVGLVAWLPLIPASAWPADPIASETRSVGLGRPATVGCGLLAALAAVAFVIQSMAGRVGPLPEPLATAIHLTFLPQEWRMFGTVRSQEQWVSCHGRLADGRVIDPLRRGQPATAGAPPGGFASLPNHRWHRFLWRLPEPAARPFGSAAAVAIARDWNGRHPPDRQLVAVEIWAGLAELCPEGTARDALLGAWPTRSATGQGNLDRFLDASAPPVDAR